MVRVCAVFDNLSCVVSSSLWDVVSLVGGASAQTAGPSGNIDVPDISQASSNDLHDGVGWGGGSHSCFLLTAPSLSSVEMTAQASFCRLTVNHMLIHTNALSFY